MNQDSGPISFNYRWKFIIKSYELLLLLMNGEVPVNFDFADWTNYLLEGIPEIDIKVFIYEWFFYKNYGQSVRHIEDIFSYAPLPLHMVCDCSSEDWSQSSRHRFRQLVKNIPEENRNVCILDKQIPISPPKIVFCPNKSRHLRR